MNMKSILMRYFNKNGALKLLGCSTNQSKSLKIYQEKVKNSYFCYDTVVNLEAMSGQESYREIGLPRKNDKYR